MNKLLDKTFERRSILLGGLKGSLLLGLLARTYTLQVIQKEHFQILSDKNRLYKFLIIPDRGIIVDRNNCILAESNNEYFILFDRDYIKNFDQTFETLKNIISLNEQDIIDIQKQLSKKQSIEPILIKNNLPLKEVYNLEVNLNHLPGIRSEKIRTRFYPDPFPLTHLLGFVGTVSTNDKKNDSAPILNEPGFKIGKTGLEKAFDLTLRGEAGEKKVEVNAYRKIVRTLSLQKSKMGEQLSLTIDMDLQKTVYNLLEPYHTGGCAVMDVHTGELLSFVSYPGFDGNLFSHKIYQKSWQALSNDPYKPLTNKLINGLYAPGSIFKMIIALAALEKGIITHQTSYHCPGHFDLNGHKFHCWSWRTGGHGHVNLTQAIGISCDVFFYHVALKLTSEEITNMAQRFGLGIPTGIELPNEKKGFIPTIDWQNNNFKRKWQKGDTINLSIGQGMLLTSPLQLCRMTACFVNGGRLINPHVLCSTTPQAELIDIKPEHLDSIKKGMEAAVNAPYGTARRAQITTKGFEMGGKTGSTQVSRITEAQRRLGTHNDRPWHLKEHALFVGYAPLHKPRFATVVLIEHGGSGGRYAAPIGKEVLLKTQELFS